MSTPRIPLPIFGILALVLFQSLEVAAADAPNAAGTGRVVKLAAKDVFDFSRTVVFQDDFSSGAFGRGWRFSENANYNLPGPSPARIAIVDAPGLDAGRRAVRFEVRRAPDSFRSEISLPHESGFQERWYAGRIFVPETWVPDPGRGNDIVMQWHAIPGNWRATYPNLEISIGHTNWFVRQSFGDAQGGPMRTNTKLDDPMRPGTWVAWVIHAKWSPGPDGRLRIWKDGQLAFERTGPNVYSTIGVEYTPYVKTGIYHPEWHLDKDGKRETFENEKPAATNKVVYVTDFKVGDARAIYSDLTP